MILALTSSVVLLAFLIWREGFGVREVNANLEFDDHHRRRPRPKKLRFVARPVSREARGFDHRRSRTRLEAIPGRAVRFDSTALRRPTGAAPRHLGNGDGLRKPARQSEHAVGRCNSRIRLPPDRIFHRAALRHSEADRSRRPIGKHARLHARRNRPDAVLAEEHPGLSVSSNKTLRKPTSQQRHARKRA